MARCPKCSVSFRVREDEQLDITECPACGYSENEEVIGECAGCQEDIVSGEYRELYFEGEQYLLHENSECCSQFVYEISFSRTAG